MIGGGCRIWDTDFHELDWKLRFTQTGGKSAPITIGDYAWVGGGSIILKGVSIGERAIIGAGSVVTKDVPDDEIWGGNLARFIRKL